MRLRWPKARAASSVARQLFPYTRPHRRTFFSASVCTLFFVVVDLARPWPVKIVIDQVILGEPWTVIPAALSRNPMLLLAVSCVALLLLATLSGVLAYARTVLLAQAGHAVVADIRKDLYKRLLRMSGGFHGKHSRGDLLVRLTGDATAMKTLLVEGIFALAQELILIVGVLLVMLLLDWRLALIASVTVPAAAWIVTHYGRRLKRAAQKQRKKEGEIGNVANEALSAVSVIQAYSLHQQASRWFRERNRSSKNAGVRAARLEGSMSRWTEIAIAAGTASLLFFGARQVLDGRLTAGELIVFVSYVRAFYKPMRRLSTRSARVLKSAAAGQRVLEILQTTPDLVSPEHPLKVSGVRGQIELNDVWHEYSPGHPVLRGVSLSIEPGERVAVWGHNGAGKSTLAALLPRLVDPTSGVVRLDGHDVRQFDLDFMRRQFGVVFQDSVLFDGSIRENVLLGSPDASPEAIDEALARSGVATMVSRLRDGLDTAVGASGQALSGGERQRVALARALVRRAPTLLLDEPAASLDASSAVMFDRQLLDGLDGVTVLLITHHWPSVEALERVIVLDRGRVVADGPPAQARAWIDRHSGLLPVEVRS